MATELRTGGGGEEGGGGGGGGGTFSVVTKSRVNVS